MNAKTDLQSRLPNRDVTVGDQRASRRSFSDAARPSAGVTSRWTEAAPFESAARHQASAVKKGIGSGNAALHLDAIKCAIELDTFDVTETFKKTPCVAGLKPLGRDVAKDIYDVVSIPLLMKTLLDHGYAVTPFGWCA